MKKQKFVYALLAVVLTMAMLLGACRTAAPTATQAPAAEPTKAEAAQPGQPAKPVAAAEDFKIGILTGTVSQGEEEFNEAQNQVKVYGDMIVHNTYPDNFSSETETTISQAVALASDPKVKAIVWVQGVPGTAPAIDKIREIRQDIAIIVGVPAENPDVISAKADIVMAVDEISMGKTIPDEAAKMGAKVFIHYSFPRHMGYATIAARHAIMVEECKKLGIEFVDITAPDPTGDAGISGAQQFITEDVKRQIEKYGIDTAFFSTNCGMQEPLIREVWKNGGIFPQQCCPSPYHGYPSALGIDVKGHEGDVQYMLDQIQAKLVEKSQQARMSTWGVPINMLMIDAGVRYGIKYAKGEVKANDLDAFKATVQEAAAARQVGNLDIGFYTENSVDYKNYLLLLAPFYDFSK